MDLLAMGSRAKVASRVLMRASTAQKDAALLALAILLEDQHNAAQVLAANAADLSQARDAGMSPALLDRLALTPHRLASIAADVRSVIALPDPVGEQIDRQPHPAGLDLQRVRTPLGVIGVIYEARPNVTVDVAALCLKSGNAAILRGGKEIMRSCAALGILVRQALATAGLPADAIQTIDDPDRALMQQLLRLDASVDVIIPRGGAALHRFCREHATVPVITGGIGVCHIYVDAAADQAQVVPIVRNAKIQRPGACNALDTLLVHRALAAQVLPAVVADLVSHGVELRLDEQALAIASAAGVAGAQVCPATAADFGTEFLALVASVRVVEDLDAAVAHIAQFGSGHTEAILSQDQAACAEFVAAVDAAVVMVNASTRFNDGAQLGLGAEIAISTQKLHARGPMALRELTTNKWIVTGNGQVRF